MGGDQVTKTFGCCVEGEWEPLKSFKSGWRTVIRFAFEQVRMVTG